MHRFTDQADDLARLNTNFTPHQLLRQRDHQDLQLFLDLFIQRRQRVFEEVDQRLQVVSDLNFAIDAAFRREGIEIPFPQRDLHIRDWPGSRRLPPGPAGEDDSTPTD